jgi:phosphatidate cytidylyltransferase
MPKKANLIFVRTLSILMAAPPVLFAIYVGRMPFFVLGVGALFLSIYEFIGIYAKRRKPAVSLYTLYPLSFLVLALAYYKPHWFEHYLLPLLWVVVAFNIFAWIEIQRGKMLAVQNVALYFLRGMMMITVPFTFLAILRGQHHGLPYFIVFMLTVWIFDTFAYLAGSKFGKHKLYEKISPKKTIEGFVGGAVAVFIFLMGIKFFPLGSLGNLGLHWHTSVVLILSIAIPVLSTLGDLAESLLKRQFQVKNSGDFLPGHGGILDRMDSFIFVSPLYFYLIVWGVM